jgi:hypothetical protein
MPLQLYKDKVAVNNQTKTNLGVFQTPSRLPLERCLNKTRIGASEKTTISRGGYLP